MKRCLALLIVAIALLVGCETFKWTSMPTESPKEGDPAQVTVVGVEQSTVLFRPGIVGIDIAIKNISSDPIAVDWSKSSIEYGNISHTVFLTGQKFETAGQVVLPNRMVAPGSNLVTGVYSSDSPYFYQDQFVSEWRLAPIMQKGELDVLICVELNGKEYYYTAKAEIQ